jgi:hypothetical protein
VAALADGSPQAGLAALHAALLVPVVATTVLGAVIAALGLRGPARRPSRPETHRARAS